LDCSSLLRSHSVGCPRFESLQAQLYSACPQPHIKCAREG
jgi:hypothetical protein